MRALLAFALLLLAGCSAPTAPVGAGPPGVDAALASEFLAPVLVGRGGDAESSLDVGADGTLLACSHGGFTQASPMWASTDGGASFARLDLSATAVGGDCDVAVGDGVWYEVSTSDRIFEVAGKQFADTFALRVATSRDAGKSWRVTEPAPGAELHDRPWLWARGGVAYLAYIPARDPGLTCLARCVYGETVLFQRSTDGGATWSPAVVAMRAPPQRIFPGDLVATDDGQHVGMPLLLVDEATGARSFVYASSDDGGSSWSSNPVPMPATQLSGFASAAYAPDGALRLAAIVGPRYEGALTVTSSKDHGRTWSEPVSVVAHVSAEPSATTFRDTLATVALAVDGRGVSTLAWLDARSEGGGIVWTAHVARASAEGALLSTGLVAAPTSGAWRIASEFLQARTGPDGRTFVLYPWSDAGCAAKPAGAEDADPPRNEQCVMLVAQRS